MGFGGISIALSMNSIRNTLSCGVVIRKDKKMSDFLQLRREEIEKEIGEKTEWRDRGVTSMIKITKQTSDVFAKNQTEDFLWLYKQTVLFQKVFGRHFKEFNK